MSGSPKEQTNRKWTSTANYRSSYDNIFKKDRPMTGNEYQKHVNRTANTNLDQFNSIVNCEMGLSGETGELSDLLKKILYHGHGSLEDHTDKLAKELGDILWYIARLATCLNMNLDDIMAINVLKLRQRYPEGFSVADSLARKDVNSDTSK